MYTHIHKSLPPSSHQLNNNIVLVFHIFYTSTLISHYIKKQKLNIIFINYAVLCCFILYIDCISSSGD